MNSASEIHRMDQYEAIAASSIREIVAEVRPILADESASTLIPDLAAALIELADEYDEFSPLILAATAAIAIVELAKSEAIQ